VHGGLLIRHRIAAGALVVENDRLLMLHHVRPGIFDFWLPPGGGVEGAESLQAAAIREVIEETGLTIEPTCLAYIDELLISGNTRQCKFWFLARIVGGSIDVSGEAAQAEHIVEAAFISREEMAGKTVFPEVVRGTFWEHLRAGFTQPRYTGVRKAVIDYVESA
jgi:8-oxo-dGTP diphosphatase